MPFPPKLSPQQYTALELAYQQTLYEVLAHERTITVRVDIRNVELDYLLQRHQRTDWTIVTAYNPYSQQLSAAENELRNMALTAVVEQSSFPYLKAIGRDPSGEWTPESSLFIMGMGGHGAIALGKQFEQNAILYGTLENPPKLVWLLN